MKITEILAIYAACLSTLVFVWNIAKATPKFKVDLLHGIEEKDGEYVEGIYVIVRNHSSHKIHLAGLVLLYQSEKQSILKKLLHFIKYRNWSNSLGWVHCYPSSYGVEHNFPVELEAFQSHELFIPNSVVDEVLEKGINRKIKAKAQDQLWRNKYSKALEY
ncbi:hypothetical protein N480_03600 [Pseudoalteromonas luteoviolacea S2607]|uniref:hypothetical protein n=1 Tax=Pseudoalteromonas luteoviolacea TaxID=43657 RepID=UPI0007B043C1|nr:hypothetical protein [Pseudoalteromonas luteoviolacea]KZN30042.1 hypothetical protein N480_03600 [Pseudoalteromonas luteoviolacea S2607]